LIPFPEGRPIDVHFDDFRRLSGNSSDDQFGDEPMKYLCLVFVDESKLTALSPAAAQALDDDSLAYDRTLREHGHFVAAQALGPVSAGAVVRVRDGEIVVTDGPFAETHEQVGGFILIDARDLNEAIRLASRIPAIRMGAIEVRPIKELTASITNSEEAR
jgi:hypothetical protein